MKHFSLKTYMLGVMSAVIIAALVFLGMYYLPVPVETRRPDSLAALKKIGEVERTIRSRYIEEVSEEHLTDYMLMGLVAGLDDRYAEYFTAEEYAEVRRQNAGVMQGIGVSIMQDAETGRLVVAYVLEESPALEAGVQENDRILAINGEDTTGMTATDAAGRIQAIEGPVTLLLGRGEEELELSMEKREIRSVAVSSQMLEDDIGYIAIRTFNGVTSEQFAEAYGSLKEQNMRALIIDLRGNLGGLVNACCDTVEQLMPEGVIVYEQDREGEERHQDSKTDTPVEVPTVLLVNANTASASEIFTGALRDHDLATVIGEQTYGKGVEQNTYLLSDGSAVKLTTTVYYTPDHTDLNGTGITPDIVVEMPKDAETDVQLEAAVEYLQK